MNADIAPAVRERPHRRRRMARSSTPMPWLRAGSALVAALCLALALGLAWRHPLGAAPVAAGVLVVAVLARYFWAVWPGWMLALVPLIGLAPWSGWLWIEEWDLLLLASAAGGYAAIAGPHRQSPPSRKPLWRRPLRWHAFTGLALVLTALTTGLAVMHGVLDGGGLDLALYQGYLQTGQSLRAAKPVLALALMMPLWLRSARRAPEAVSPALMAGMLGVLLVCALGALYERLAFAGLASFNTDYRTTSLFWEMHVGGAALEGALALSLPFALLALLSAERRIPSAAALALALLGVYALLTTFSRGLYLGALLGLLLTTALWLRQRGWRSSPVDVAQVRVAAGQPPLTSTAAWLALVLIVLLGAAVGWQLFPTSGHRGLLCVAAAMVALVLQPGATSATGRQQRAVSTGFGLVMAAPVVGLGALAAQHIDKAAYMALALTLGLSLVWARGAWQGRAPWTSALGDSVRAAAWLASVGLTGVVAWSWGGTAARDAAVLPLAVLALAWPLTQIGTLGAGLAAVGWRPRLWVMGALTVVVAAVAMLGGGQVASKHAPSAEDRLSGRLGHWQRVVAMVDAADGELLGVGSGRFVAHFAANAPLDERIGDLRHLRVPEPHMAMVAGRHAAGFGHLLRLSQYLADAPPSLVLNLQVRNARPVVLHTEVCERHLLYVGACFTQSTAVAASHDLRAIRIDLGGNGELGERGWLSKHLVFAIAVESPGLKVDITRLSLKGSDGAELLRNGAFADNTAHWFFSSDRHHLPWHAKNLALHLYFEQGWVGLLLGLALFGLALARVTVGSAARHPVAPALAGALLAFFVVGLFDSLLDVARIAFLYGTVLLLALGLRATPPPSVVATPKRTR